MRLSRRAAAGGLALALLAACATAGPEPARLETGASEEPRGFDHPGGWQGASACVDICGVTPGSPVERPPAVVCFDEEDADCAAKTGEGDFDYLVLSQHWLPAVCAGLAAGYDTTLTYAAGARCRSDVPTALRIHGLWPNYEGGFPQCCGEAAPLDPAAAAEWPDILVQRLGDGWPDPTVGGFEPAICHNYNHEWQKHGTCFGHASRFATRNYFSAGLKLASRLETSTAAIDSWAGEKRERAELESVYSRRPRLMCDARQPERLLEVHTCWDRKFGQLDCPESGGFGPLVPCGEWVTLPE